MGKVADRDIYKTKTGPTTGPGLNGLAENQGAFRETLGALPPKDITILDGAITGFEEAALIVDTEGGGAADNLDVISDVISATEKLHPGMLITLRAKDPARVVTVKNSVSPNGINTADGNDIVLSTAWELTLRLVGGRWYEVPGRASAQAAEALSTAEDAQDDAAFAQSTAAAAKAVTDTATSTPTPNAVPIADADGKLDAWVTPGADTDLSNVDLTKANVILQQVRYETHSSASGTTSVPWDTTIPQQTEGDQYLSATITPKKADSVLMIEAEVSCAMSRDGNAIMSLFKDSGANALACSWGGREAGTASFSMQLRHYMSSGTTSPITFKVRCGNGSVWGGTFYLNYNAVAGFLGGGLVSSLTITEFAV